MTNRELTKTLVKALNNNGDCSKISGVALAHIEKWLNGSLELSNSDIQKIEDARSEIVKEVKSRNDDLFGGN